MRRKLRLNRHRRGGGRNQPHGRRMGKCGRKDQSENYRCKNGAAAGGNEPNHFVPRFLLRHAAGPVAYIFRVFGLESFGP